MQPRLAVIRAVALIAVLASPGGVSAQAAEPGTPAREPAARLQQAAPARDAVPPTQPARARPAADTAASQRLQDAVRTQLATRAHLRVLGDAASCVEARFVSYRRSDVEPDIADQWYVASQLWADAILLAAPAQGIRAPVAQIPSIPGRAQPGAGQVRIGQPATGRPAAGAGSNDPEARCHLDKGFVLLDRLWDDTTGGYYPRSNPSGTAVERDVRHTDDNSLAGLALLAAAEVTPDDALRRRYLHAARRQAEFLTESGLWDETFGGGFWWNTSKGDVPEGKPAQSNALAALFFARLHDTTGVETYRAWAIRTLLWLDTILYDPARQLYRWSVHYRDGVPAISDRYFNYDQGIAVEAQLAASGLDGDPNRLARAQGIGRAVQSTFWGQERGGYNLEAGIEQVYTAFAAWVSLGHLALYDADGDARWLELARTNADALAAALGEPDGGYANRHYRCVDRSAPGCETGQVPWVVDRTRDTAAQAWI